MSSYPINAGTDMAFIPIKYLLNTKLTPIEKVMIAVLTKLSVYVKFEDSIVPCVLATNSQLSEYSGFAKSTITRCLRSLRAKKCISYPRHNEYDRLIAVMEP